MFIDDLKYPTPKLIGGSDVYGPDVYRRCPPPMMFINGMPTMNPSEGRPELVISDESAHFCRRPVRSCRH